MEVMFEVLQDVFDMLSFMGCELSSKFNLVGPWAESTWQKLLDSLQVTKGATKLQAGATFHRTKSLQNFCW